MKSKKSFFSAPRFVRSKNASFRRSVRTSTRSADSGFAAISDCSPAYHSDGDLRYSKTRHHLSILVEFIDEMNKQTYSCSSLLYRTTKERARRSSSLPRQKYSRFNRATDHLGKPFRNIDKFGPLERKSSQNTTSSKTNYSNNQRGFSLDRKREPKETVEIEMDPILLDNTPILCNKYVVGKNEGFVGPIPGKGKSTLDFIFYRCCLNLLRAVKFF